MQSNSPDVLLDFSNKFSSVKQQDSIWLMFMYMCVVLCLVSIHNLMKIIFSIQHVSLEECQDQLKLWLIVHYGISAQQKWQLFFTVSNIQAGLTICTLYSIGSNI